MDHLRDLKDVDQPAFDLGIQLDGDGFVRTAKGKPVVAVAFLTITNTPDLPGHPGSKSLEQISKCECGARGIQLIRLVILGYRKSVTAQGSGKSASSPLHHRLEDNQRHAHVDIDYCRDIAFPHCREEGFAISTSCPHHKWVTGAHVKPRVAVCSFRSCKIHNNRSWVLFQSIPVVAAWDLQY
ncbi:MAG: hypothetical protein A2134_02540 [Candidatus Woykebacteria bacterium RBG_16_39_9b]|uniref:Uncharacterized protein n=1 Tax=Candidatus Woykebacteria bacterium RBG_16_39_9b TaxID=1802595 RepID=A0A1G1WBJ8_9BACT|nr:MAG: hypothetical protein A2134_02540 [Candidatus Woykebacteria bacterium RBG_16_39_9b]